MNHDTKRTLCCPYLYRERFSLEVRRYQVAVPELPPPFHGYTILQLSDLHQKEFGPGGRDLLRLLAGLRFDLVVLTGDLVLEPAPRLEPALELIEALKPHPIYSVSGNHDWDRYDPKFGPLVKARLKEAGVRVLENECTPLQRSGAHLWLAGVDDPITRRADLLRALPQTSDRAPRLLLSHSPQLFGFAARLRVDLVLSGHTHGGQIRLPILGAPFIPKLGLFPRWSYGLYRCGTGTLIVNGGLGESWIPVRWHIPPEVVLVELTPAPPPLTEAPQPFCMVQ